MRKTKSILLVYHSGSGSTRTITEAFKAKLAHKYTVDIVQVNSNPDYHTMADYDLLIFGFPTYHCNPSPSMTQFVENLPLRTAKPQKAFVFTTYGLYTGNSIRNLIKILQKKNVLTMGYMQIRGPASDGALLFPSSLSFMFEYEQKAKRKLEDAISNIEDLIDYQSSPVKYPPYKWYVPLNAIASFFGERVYRSYKDNIQITDGKCTNCNLCVQNCLRESWKEGTEQPLFNPANCEFCLKCVHNCPEKAIIFTNKMSDKPRLNRTFYQKVKVDLFTN